MSGTSLVRYIVCAVLVASACAEPEPLRLGDLDGNVDVHVSVVTHETPLDTAFQRVEVRVVARDATPESGCAFDPSLRAWIGETELPRVSSGRVEGESSGFGCSAAVFLEQRSALSWFRPPDAAGAIDPVVIRDATGTFRLEVQDLLQRRSVEAEAHLQYVELFLTPATDLLDDALLGVFVVPLEGDVFRLEDADIGRNGAHAAFDAPVKLASGSTVALRADRIPLRVTACAGAKSCSATLAADLENAFVTAFP